MDRHRTQTLNTLLWISPAQNLVQRRLKSKAWLSLLWLSQQRQLLSVITWRYPTLNSCKSVMKCRKCKQQSICTVNHNWDRACSPERHTWQLPVKNAYTEFHKNSQDRWWQTWHSFLGVFAKLPKVIISFIMSVCPSLRQLCSNWMDFHEIWYVSIFKKSARKIQVSLKSDRIMHILHKYQYTCLSYLTHFFLDWWMFQTQSVDKIKTHFMFNNFFFFLNRAIYEIMQKNITDKFRPQMTIWHLHIACLTLKAKNVHAEYVILTAVPL